MRRLPLRRLVTLATLAVVGAATLGVTAACGETTARPRAAAPAR